MKRIYMVSHFLYGRPKEKKLCYWRGWQRLTFLAFLPLITGYIFNLLCMFGVPHKLLLVVSLNMFLHWRESMLRIVLENFHTVPNILRRRRCVTCAARGRTWVTHHASQHLRLACVKVLHYTVFEQVKCPHRWVSMVRHSQFMVRSKLLSQDLPNNFFLCSNCLSDESIGFYKALNSWTCCFNVCLSLGTSARVIHVVNRNCLFMSTNTLIVR